MADPNFPSGSIDVDVDESLREIQKQRTVRTIGVVLGLAAALVIGALLVVAAYSDESEAIRDIKAAQPESNPAP